MGKPFFNCANMTKIREKEIKKLRKKEFQKAMELLKKYDKLMRLLAEIQEDLIEHFSYLEKKEERD